MVTRNLRPFVGGASSFMTRLCDIIGFGLEVSCNGKNRGWCANCGPNGYCFKHIPPEITDQEDDLECDVLSMEDAGDHPLTILKVYYPPGFSKTAEVKGLLFEYIRNETGVAIEHNRLAALNLEVSFFRDVSEALEESADVELQIQHILQKVRNAVNADLVIVRRHDDPTTWIYFGDLEKFKWVIDEASLKSCETFGVIRDTAFALVPYLCRHESAVHFFLAVRQGKSFLPSEVRLLQSMAKRVLSLDKLEHLLSDRFQNELLKRDLEIAHTIQQKLLPSSEIAFGNFFIHGACEPAGYVGGDSVDFFLSYTGSPVMFILDVSGHSINTSIIMTTARGYLKSLLFQGFGPAAAASLVNRLLCSDIKDGGNFVTGVIMVLDTKSGTMKYCNAGHPPALLRGPSGLSALRGSSMPLGISEEEEYGETTVKIPKGSLIFAYTDGLIEAKDSQGRYFGAERVEKFVESFDGDTAESLNRGMLEKLDGFIDEQGRQDDVTVLSILRNFEDPS